MIIFSLGVMDMLNNAVLGIYRTMTPKSHSCMKLVVSCTHQGLAFKRGTLIWIMHDITLLHDRYYI